jgi:hypothetical protein
MKVRRAAMNTGPDFRNKYSVTGLCSIDERGERHLGSDPQTIE